MGTNREDLRARIFISCGQGKKAGERETAHAIAERLKALGFDPWIATEEQTLDGIKEYIFERLGDSEYFLFVDFKRERLGDDYRGSLFSHQELALASYLGVELLAFQESGVKLEGLLAFIGGNAIPFKDRATLPIQIEDEVRKRLSTGQWDSRWRNEIVLEREPTQYEDVETQVPGLYRRFFHIIVRNRHRHRAATNCYVYLEKATNLNTSNEIPLQTFELKWEGFRLPYVNIPPANHRRFDAFCIPYDSPTRLDFSPMFSDWIGIIPRVEGAGRYKLSYLVLSSNFPPARRSFILNLAPMLDSTALV